MEPPKAAKLLEDGVEDPLKAVGSAVASKMKTIFPSNMKLIDVVATKVGEDRFSQITKSTSSSKIKYKILALVSKSDKQPYNNIDATEVLKIRKATSAEVKKAKSGKAADLGDYNLENYAYARGSEMDLLMIPADTDDSSEFAADTSGEKLASVLNDLNVKDAISHTSLVLNDQKHSAAFFKSVFGENISDNQKTEFVSKFQKLKDAISRDDISASEAAKLSRDLGFNFGQFGSAGADYDGYYQAATKNLAISDSLIGTAGGVGIEGRWLSRVMVEELVHAFAESTNLVEADGAKDQGRAAMNYVNSTMKFTIGELADIPDELYVRSANGADKDDTIEISDGAIKARAAVGAATSNFFVGQLRFPRQTEFATLGDFEVRFPTITSSSGTGDGDMQKWFSNVGKEIAKKEFRWDLFVQLSKEVISGTNRIEVRTSLGGDKIKRSAVDRNATKQFVNKNAQKYVNVAADISVKMGFKGKKFLNDFTLAGSVNKNIPYISEIIRRVAPPADFDTALSGGISVKIVKGKPVHAVIFGRGTNTKKVEVGTATIRESARKRPAIKAETSILGKNVNIAYAGWVKNGKRLSGADVD